jgi:hypothetical protein
MFGRLFGTLIFFGLLENYIICVSDKATLHVRLKKHLNFAAPGQLVLSNKSYSNYFRTSSSCISGCDIPSKSVALCRKGLRNPNENLAQCA